MTRLNTILYHYTLLFWATVLIGDWLNVSTVPHDVTWNATIYFFFFLILSQQARTVFSDGQLAGLERRWAHYLALEHWIIWIFEHSTFAGLERRWVHCLTYCHRHCCHCHHHHHFHCHHHHHRHQWTGGGFIVLHIVIVTVAIVIIIIVIIISPSSSDQRHGRLSTAWVQLTQHLLNVRAKAAMFSHCVADWSRSFPV